MAQVNCAWLVTICDGRSTPENPQVISTGVGGEFLFTCSRGYRDLSEGNWTAWESRVAGAFNLKRYTDGTVRSFPYVRQYALTEWFYMVFSE